MEYLPLVRILWAHISSEFFTHLKLHFSNFYLHSLAIRIIWERGQKVLVKSMWTKCPLIYLNAVNQLHDQCTLSCVHGLLHPMIRSELITCHASLYKHLHLIAEPHTHVQSTLGRERWQGEGFFLQESSWTGCSDQLHLSYKAQVNCPPFNHIEPLDLTQELQKVILSCLTSLCFGPGQYRQCLFGWKSSQ